MGTHRWGTTRPLAQDLIHEAQSFEFQQAMRLLECLASARDTGASQAHAPVRLRSHIGFSFAPSDIVRITPAKDSVQPAELTVAFLGLAGWSGPLPAAYSEWILEREQRRDLTIRDFLDIFNHRLLWYFYQGRKKHRLSLLRETPAQSRIAKLLYALFGLHDELSHRQYLPDRRLLRYAGLLADQRRSMCGLTRMLSDYFGGMEVRGRSFTGGWEALEEGQRMRIGRTGNPQGLGIDTLLGSRFWDQHAGITLEIGPLSYKRLVEFLPHGPAYPALVALLKFYLGTRCVFCRLVLRLHAEDEPGLRLGASSARLGWTSWLAGGKQSVDRRIRLDLPLGEIG